MTRREKVIKTLEIGELSCAELCDIILQEEQYSNEKCYRHAKKNLTSSLSGTLNKMVRRAEIEISSNKGPKGGKIYKLKENGNI